MSASISLHSLKTSAGRLRENGARLILQLRKDGRTYQEIAGQLAVSIGTVFNVCKGRTWSWLREDEAPPTTL